ncbi:MAG: hypothetical protein KAI57_00920 [Candidatus Pacebacteria bacterium]|nr:hypothetical protein [Candidatus Paceibacterota bacterium]
MTIKENLSILLAIIFLGVFSLQLPEIVIGIKNSIGISGMVLMFVFATLIFLYDDFQRKSFDNKCCDFLMFKKEG